MNDPIFLSPVCKIARITGKPGRAQELRSALSLLEKKTRQETGCIEFGFFQSISQETEFFLLEHFASAAALQEHMQYSYTREFFAAQLVESVQAVDVPSLGQRAV